MKKTILITIIIFLTGCGVWRPYTGTHVETDNIFGEEYRAVDTANIAGISWREFFNDGYLRDLIAEGLTNNSDLNIARLAIDQAESALRSARLSYIPSFSFGPQGTVSSFDIKKATQIYSVPVAASWELDIFGGITNAKRRSKAAYEQTIEYKKAVQTRMISTIASLYYTLLMLDKQYEISIETAAVWSESIETMRLMMEAGMFTQAAISQNEAVYYGIEASLFELREKIITVENSLSSLLMRTPGRIECGDLDQQNFSEMLDYGIPVQLLSNRPDVRSAEYDLIQAYYAANEARAHLYPSLMLNGSTGWTNSAGSYIVNPGKLLLSAAASLTQPVFNRRMNRSQLEIAKASQEQAAIRFQQVVLDAGAEVNSSLVRYRTAADKKPFLANQIESLETAVESTQLLMDHGSTTYLEILTARQNLLSARLSYVGNQFQEIQAAINLYAALGGGTDE